MTTRIYLEWPGRLCNQIMLWAGAFRLLGGSNKMLLIDCQELRGRVQLPQTANEPADTSKWPRRLFQDRISGDGNWVWVDGWEYRLTGTELSQVLRHIDWGPTRDEALGVIAAIGPSVVGVHYRCGDYLGIDHNNPPDFIPNFVRAPLSYFRGHMQHILMQEPATRFFVATDGSRDDYNAIAHGYPCLAGRPDDPLFDLLALSCCCRVIGSDSTFSHVAGAIGRIPVTYPSTYQHEQPTCEVRSEPKP